MILSPLDWSILAVYVASCFLIGIYCKKFIGSTADFLLAGRGVGLHLGIATFSATEIGTITFMYYAELGYRYGFAPFVIALLAGFVMLFVGRTGFMVEKMRELNLTTVPEYCEIRYTRRLRVLVGVLAASGGIIGTGVFLKVEASFFTLFTGISPKYLICIMVGILLLELLYSVLGGMISIVLTDLLQYVLLSVATIIISILSVHQTSWSRIVFTVHSTMGDKGFNPLTNPAFGWTFIVWQILAMIAGYTCWPATAMRTFSMQNKDMSRRMFTWLGFIFMGRGMLPILWGIAALVALGPHQVAIEAMPVFIRGLLGNGVRGLVLAGMIAATMSVNASYLLAWSSIISQDIILPLRKTKISEKGEILINRLCNLFVSIFIMFWSLWYKPPGATYLYLQISGTIFLAGLFSCVFAGLYWKRASAAGAYSAMVLGAVTSIGYLVLDLPANYAGFGAFGAAAFGMVVGSLIRPAATGTYDSARQTARVR